MKSVWLICSLLCLIACKKNNYYYNADCEQRVIELEKKVKNLKGEIEEKEFEIEELEDRLLEYE